MKEWDYDAVVFDGAVYCVGCLPDRVTAEDDACMPVFPASEWGYVPTCDACGAEHDYVTVLE